MASPIFKVPFCTITVAVGPRPTSWRASTITPSVTASGFAFNSINSACSKIMSSSSSTPSALRAEIGTVTTSPPQSSEATDLSCICVLTLSASAPFVSILLMATRRVPWARWANFKASSVWGINPSSAATTKTETSVKFAPLSRILEKAACPGVSRKVIFWLLCSIW